MVRNICILGLSAAVVALPFVFRQKEELSGWRRGDPVLVVISPHNEAIRYEFGQAFSRWHQQHFGRPAKVDWRSLGGTTEIMRYLESEYVAAFRAWWKRRGVPSLAGDSGVILETRFDPRRPDETAATPAARELWTRQREAWQAFRAVDDPRAFSCRIDVLFGGGSYDHDKAYRQGLTVRPWDPAAPPADTLASAGGKTLLPEARSGEAWRGDAFFGAALSTFGICYNVDRLRDLRIANPPRRWSDLAAPAYIGQLGVADPTKSGSISKAFEMIVHEQCGLAVRAAGFPDEQVARFEARIREANLPPGRTPEGIPRAYQDAIEQGWLHGIRLVQRIAANARYFTDSAGKVPIDVGMGDAAAGIAIDFYGRYQAEVSKGPAGRCPMAYITPAGGSSVSADPISLLRGAEHRELAVRFIAFVLGEEGQKLWNYAPGAPGGPQKFALRRLPVRRDFYPSDDPELHAAYVRHKPHTVDDLGDPNVNPYVLAEQFTYRPRWTAAHFNVHRDLIRAMGMDAGEELRAAWRAIVEHGGPAANAEAVALLARMPDRPEPLTWLSAQTISKRHPHLDYMREWTLFFRRSYAEARQMAERNPAGRAGAPPAGATRAAADPAAARAEVRP